MALTVDQHAEFFQKVMLATREMKRAVLAACSISQLYFVQFWYKTVRITFRYCILQKACFGPSKSDNAEESLPSYPLMVAISDTLKVSMEFLTRGVEGSSKSVEKETLFCIPEAKGLTEDEYQFIEKSMKDLIKNLKKRKS